MIHNEITEKILKACFQLRNELGCGFVESVYEKALLIALREDDLDAVRQAPITVKFRKQDVGLFYADLLVEDKIIVELKATSSLLPEHIAQTINYLKATGKQVGLLVSFGNPRLEYRRINNTLDYKHT